MRATSGGNVDEVFVGDDERRPIVLGKPFDEASTGIVA